MRITRYYTTLILLLLGINSVYSQENRTEICIDFRVNSAIIDATYSGNAASMEKIVELLHGIRQDSTIRIIEVSFCGAASPEGSYQLNRRLAQRRLTALENFVSKEVDIPDSLITRNTEYILWDYLKQQVLDAGLPHKDEVISIIGEDASLVDYHHPNTHVDGRIVKLKALQGGKVWQQMHKLFFKSMRNACVVLVTYKKALPTVLEQVALSENVKTVLEPHIEVMDTATESSVVKFIAKEVVNEGRKLHLKTNIAGLGMAITNIAAEIDLADHWSFALPVYYSAWNYFKTTIKFRTLAIQPELRYWPLEENDGPFAGIHLGMAYYNYAFDKKYRYQDHKRRTPAIGGGISLGYRIPVSKNERWRVEFALGAGIYPLHYDKFHNTPNTKDGLMIKSIRKTYCGIDQAAISLTYSINLKKRGGNL